MGLEQQFDLLKKSRGSDIFRGFENNIKMRLAEVNAGIDLSSDPKDASTIVLINDLTIVSDKASDRVLFSFIVPPETGEIPEGFALTFTFLHGASNKRIAKIADLTGAMMTALQYEKAQDNMTQEQADFLLKLLED